MTPEQRHNDWIRSALEGADVARIENCVQLGMPDMNICLHGLECWVESKVANGRGIVLRKEQFAWGVRRAQHGGSVFIVARIHDELILLFKYPNLSVRPRGDQRTLDVVSEAYARIPGTDQVCKRMLRKALFPEL